MRKTRKNKGGNLVKSVENDAKGVTNETQSQVKNVTTVVEKNADKAVQKTQGFLSGLLTKAQTGVSNMTKNVKETIGGKPKRKTRKTKKSKYSKKSRKRR